VKVIKRLYGDKIADRSYWWLCVAGFFQFTDSDYWFDSDEWWEYSVDYTHFSNRALALCDKITYLS
jgi:hypothetical protein